MAEQIAETSSPSPESVRAELRMICDSAAFGAAPRLRKLLAYLVERWLVGNAVKEAIIAVELFGREPGYDPKQDSVVRTEVRRLRAKLLEYYAVEGAADGIMIELPKGSYTPAFRCRETVAAPRPALPLPPPRSQSRLLVVFFSAVSLALLGVALLWYRSTDRAKAGRAFPRRSVAVLDFRNLTSRAETDWLAAAIAEMIRADLASGQQMRTIPGENVARMESELSLQHVSSPSRETLLAIRRDLGADVVVSGAFADLGTNGVRINVWAEDAQTGDVIASISESGTEAGLLGLVARTGAHLKGSLGLPVTSAGEIAMRSVSPQDPSAERAYGEALGHWRRGDWLQARDLLKKCVQIEPGFAPAHTALASAYDKLGYDALAQQEAKRASELASTMSDPDQRLAIEAQYRAVNHQWDRAMGAYGRLFAAHSDDIEYGLQLAWAQIQGFKAEDALRTLDALRKLPGPESDDPRIDYAAAKVYGLRSDYRSAADLSGAGAHKAQSMHANLLYAYGLSSESAALLNLGDPRWEALSQETLRICSEFGDNRCVTETLRRMGNARVVGALDLAGAEHDFNEAIRIARKIGSVVDEAVGLNGLALAFNSRGELNRGVEVLRQVQSLGREIPNPGIEEIALDNLGDSFLNLLRLGEARESLEAAVAIAGRLDHREWVADELRLIAQIDEIEGHLTQARTVCRDALAGARRTGSRYQLEVLLQSARVFWAEDDLASAQQALGDASHLSVSWRAVAGADRLMSARVELAASKPAEAIPLAREATLLAADHHLPHIQARAETVLAQALFAAGNRREAEAAIAQAWKRVEHSEFRQIRLEAGITRALITRLTIGLPELIAEAHAGGAYELELQGRMVGAEIAGNHAQMVALRAEALKRGFRYLARAQI